MESVDICVAPRSYWRGFVSVYVGLIDNIHYFFVSYNYDEKNEYKILKKIKYSCPIYKKIFSKRFNEKLELASFNVLFISGVVFEMITHNFLSKV